MRSSQITNALLALSVPLLAGTASASTIQARDVQLTAQQIEAIAPTSNTCDGAPAPGECATSEQAALNIAKSFETYQVTSPAEQAAVIGLMAMESGDFKYSRNQVNIGQGTRNMQSPAFNSQYAASLPGIADQAAALASDPAGLLDALVANEEYDFGSGAWFLTTQCTPDVRTQLQTGSEEGWASFISGCVGTDANEARRDYWTRAVEALGASA
ncbi:hypothetical protein P170DRAFT_185013 [Aspergillus steynii IBT 23096]|uniref:Transglycosylase SLT domain-containing protein n=1 Tax=Aspergillus steynii IBT 23096 TaxID=1392250 RepID=A0A2I2G9C9_9EURO|nr:uncharacterized protein P170DRAFT_185013 [Aspergillus steynii IBT 23096]PLB49482.1 hypothetical protein P170DRAFT_185013 [Aspergillus steynii IBT 23096]